MADIRPLVPELAQVARNNLLESEASLIAEVEVLRSWIEEQPYLKARTDDQFLVAFLRFNKHNLDSAKQRICFYYTYKTKEADLIKSRAIDDKMMEMARSGIFASLPNAIGPGGPRIHFTRMGLIDTSKFTVQEIFRFHVFRSEIELNTDDNWVISGVVEILDFTKIPYSLLLQFDPGMFRRMNAFLEHGVPTNLVATHIVNASKETQFVLGLIRNVMKQKELLHIHPNVESLQTAIGKEYLPVELGGNNGTLPEATAACVENFNKFVPYFRDDDKFCVDEKLRPEEKKSQSFLADSTEGSFRKLNFD